MTFLPIVERELRAAARRPATYRTRMGFVIVTSVLAAGLLLVGDTYSIRQLGNTLFPVLTGFAFFYCLLAGARQAADCLSEEKREGTLGLMFLTDLRGHDVVLGKLVAVSTRAFQGLFAIFPVLSITLLLGGITGGEFWRTTAVLANALFFALALGLCVSSLTREAHAAVIGTLLGLVVVLAVPWLADKVLILFGSNRHVLGWLSPACAGLLASDASYHVHPSAFWATLAGNHLLGWSLLAAASIALPHSWQERSIRTHAARPGTELPFIGRPVDLKRRTAFRTQLLDINPIYWLAARNDRQRVLLWTFVPVLACCGVFLFLADRTFAGTTFGMATFLNFGVALVLKLWVAWQACATLAEARRNGAAELLLATPLRVQDILSGHWQALQRLFLVPVIAALVLQALPVIETMLREPLGRTPLLWLPFPTAATVFAMATFVLDLVALAWVGMWMGLTQPRTIQAFGKTVLYVVLVPMLVFCFPNILFDLFWITWARRKLENEFRSAAAQEPPPVFATVAPPVIH